MALHEKSSCCGVKLPHGLRSTSENHSHLTQSAAASIHATWISVTQGESHQLYAVITLDSQDQSPSQIVKNTVEMCAVLKWVHISTCFLGKMDVEFSVLKTKGTIQTFHQWQMQSTHLSWYMSAAEKTAWVTGICVKVPLTLRHILVLYRVGMHQMSSNRNCSAENSKKNSFGVRPNKWKDRIICTEQWRDTIK